MLPDMPRRLQTLTKPIDRPGARLKPVRMLLCAAIAAVVGGCANVAPVNSPCGVIEDSLIDVAGKTRGDDERIARHFERGVAAGCWGRA